MILGLGIILCAIALPRGPVPEMGGPVPGGPAPAGQTQRVAAVGLAVPLDVDWEKTDYIKTVDPDPGGRLQIHPGTGRVRTCDIEPDSHYVRGYVYIGEKQVATMRAGKDGACDEPDNGYKLLDNVQYKFKICLGSSKGMGYCNTSNTAKWPKADRNEGYCGDNFEGEELVKCQGGDSPCDLIKGQAKKYCEAGTGESSTKELCENITDTIAGLDPCQNFLSTEKPDVLPPPKGGPEKSISDRPEETLKLRGHADKASEVADPLRVLNGWLVWFALGACMIGLMLVGGNMALKHKRGEVGAHAAGLGWVMLACLVVGSGLVMGLVSLLFDPL
ncbi:hypothetical protein HUT06_05335 [Actinomadura sp. NAK00032]|uniref:hypothetical protein n=1 Tax=Actinomadura sp. NAK00032 TaxID=2742128 RepID=UPI0015913262|nr:hypothetical protein [Actinomadura sp. NAK00032]QKW33524.1 hypothetical protein HUT06_05335 [Actinomadura sp. NAK00032]